MFNNKKGTRPLSQGNLHLSTGMHLLKVRFYHRRLPPSLVLAAHCAAAGGSRGLRRLPLPAARLEKKKGGRATARTSLEQLAPLTH